MTSCAPHEWLDMAGDPGVASPASGAANARRVWFLRLWLGVSDKTGPTCLHAIGSNKQTRETKTWSLKQSLTCYSDFLEIQSALTIQERKYSIHKMWTNIKKTLKVHFLSEKVFIPKWFMFKLRFFWRFYLISALIPRSLIFPLRLRLRMIARLGNFILTWPILPHTAPILPHSVVRHTWTEDSAAMVIISCFMLNVVTIYLLDYWLWLSFLVC